jgi:hypothetical protein
MSKYKCIEKKRKKSVRNAGKKYSSDLAFVITQIFDSQLLIDCNKVNDCCCYCRYALANGLKYSKLFS